MQVKRNQVVIIAPQEREYDKPRLAIVKSVRKNGVLNLTFSMYKGSTVMTDYLCDATDVIAITDVEAKDFRNLSTCFPNKDPNDRFIKMQNTVDAVYPQYAAMRKDYGPRESIEEGIARLRREGVLAAA
jgi:23S rRNA A2030 N6-methylase RlmJ